MPALVNGFLPNKDPSLPDLLAINNIGIGAFPIAILKLWGFPVKEGNINKEEVYQFLDTYHPLADEWAKVMSSQLKVLATILNILDIQNSDMDPTITIRLCQTMLVTLLVWDLDPSSTYKLAKASIFAF